MTVTRPGEGQDLGRLAEATAWRVRLAEHGAESTEAFEAWIGDPLNETAWNQVQQPWSLVGEQATSPELMSMRAGALDRARAYGRRRWSPPGHGGRIAAGLAIVILAGGAWSGWRWLEAQPQVYRTTLGERRVIPLPDGSRISLDSGSEVRIRFTKDARKLELAAGQARFDVAHDIQRPFSVVARNETVVATGTAFNVDLLGPKVLVTLIEGKVVVLQQRRAARRSGLSAGPSFAGPLPPPAVTSSSADPPTVVLIAGQQLVETLAAPPKVSEVNLEHATAWESGQLVFADEALSAVAERISRYAAHPVTVADGAGALRMSGVFRAGDTSTFVDAVTRYLPVEAQDAPDGTITLRPRA